MNNYGGRKAYTVNVHLLYNLGYDLKRLNTVVHKVLCLALKNWLMGLRYP